MTGLAAVTFAALAFTALRHWLILALTLAFVSHVQPPVLTVPGEPATPKAALKLRPRDRASSSEVAPSDKWRTAVR